MGEPLRASRLRRAIRYITLRAAARAAPTGGSASMRFAEGRAFPLATAASRRNIILFLYLRLGEMGDAIKQIIKNVFRRGKFAGGRASDAEGCRACAAVPSPRQRAQV